MFSFAGYQAASAPPAAAASTTYNIFGARTPTVAAANDAQAVELGMRFRPSRSGKVVGVRFYKSTRNTGTHTGSLWSNGGTLLARGTFTNETASGWQGLNFATPVSVSAGTTYVISYHTNSGYYAADPGFFKTATTNGPLTALADGTSGRNSVYAYGSSRFPTSTYQATNYWVDAKFVDSTTTATTSTTKPTTSTTKPTTTTTKPTTTTTKPTSGNDPSNCALNAAGEPCWAANTGVPGWTEAQIVAGQSPLTRVVGDQAITADGTVIQDKWIDGCISVRASNVIIRRSLIRTDHLCIGGKSQSIEAVISTGDNGGGGIKNLLVEDVEIHYTKTAGYGMAIGQTEYTARRVNAHGTSQTMKADQNVTVQDSYIHDPLNDNNQHIDGIFYDGGEGNIKIVHNWVKASYSYVSGAICLNNDWPGHYVTIDRNYAEGWAGTDLCGGAFDKASPHFDHVSVTNNALSPNNGYGGTQFVIAYDVNMPGNVWSGNYNSETKQIIPTPSL